MFTIHTKYINNFFGNKYYEKIFILKIRMIMPELCSQYINTHFAKYIC